jgi:hypothetical protein
MWRDSAHTDAIAVLSVVYPICGANTANPLNVNDDDLHTTELTVESRVSAKTFSNVGIDRSDEGLCSP